MKVASGEVDAAVRVVGKPVPHIAQIPPDAGLHLVPIAFPASLTDYYAIGEFTNADYPNLIPQGQSVDTVAVPTVLAVYNWPKGSDRYRKVERFIIRLFENWDKLRDPPYHPKWRDVNFAATVPGWKRYVVAEEQLARLTANRDFNAFLTSRPAPVQSSNQAARDALFEEFLQWRERQAAQAH